MERTQSSLEQAELNCRRQDASQIRKFARNLWNAMTAAHDPNADALEMAKLACQKRDAAVLRHSMASSVQASTQPVMGRTVGA